MSMVEVGPGGAHDVLEIPEGSSYFHANTFQRLQVAQLHEESSIHRLKRAAEIFVSCPSHVFSHQELIVATSPLD